MVVVVGTLEAMDRGGDHIIEIVQCPGPRQRIAVEQVRIAIELGASLLAQRAKKVLRVYAREATFDEARSTLEIEWHRDRDRTAYLTRQIGTPFTEPLEQHVAAEREAGDADGLTGMLAHQSTNDEVEIGRLSRVVE